MIWLSMNGRFRSQPAGGGGNKLGLVRKRTPVYKMTGRPSVSTVAQPLKQPGRRRGQWGGGGATHG